MEELNKKSIEKLSKISTDLIKQIANVILEVPATETYLYDNLIKTMAEAHELVVSIDIYDKTHKDNNNKDLGGE